MTERSREDEADWRAARRAVARQLHPDLGGDLEVYLAAMTVVDRRFGVGPTPTDSVTSARSRRLSARRIRQTVRQLRTKLPRRLPGARRYARL